VDVAGGFGMNAASTTECYGERRRFFDGGGWAVEVERDSVIGPPKRCAPTDGRAPARGHNSFNAQDFCHAGSPAGNKKGSGREAQTPGLSGSGTALERAAKFLGKSWTCCLSNYPVALLLPPEFGPPKSIEPRTAELWPGPDVLGRLRNRLRRVGITSILATIVYGAILYPMKAARE